MSEERAKVAERVLRAVNERDHATLGTLLHPDYEFHSVFAALEGGTVFRGSDGIRDLFTALDAAWENLTWHLESVRDAGDVSVVFYRVDGTARASGVPLDEEVAMVWTWRDEKPIRSQTYMDRAKALEAAGLQE